MNEQEARYMLRLIETVKYLGGIAEKGEGRQQRGDETTEQFVLGYVKRLEKELVEYQAQKEAALRIADQHSDVVNNMILQLTECEKDRDAWENACAHWEKEAIESQAREAKLREALSTALGCVDVYYIPALKDEFALADTPQDDTALKEYRKRVLLEAANAFEDGAFETPWGLRRMAEE